MESYDSQLLGLHRDLGDLTNAHTTLEEKVGGLSEDLAGLQVGGSYGGLGLELGLELGLGLGLELELGLGLGLELGLGLLELGLGCRVGV